MRGLSKNFICCKVYIINSYCINSRFFLNKLCNVTKQKHRGIKLLLAAQAQVRFKSACSAEWEGGLSEKTQIYNQTQELLKHLFSFAEEDIGTCGESDFAYINTHSRTFREHKDNTTALTQYLLFLIRTAPLTQGMVEIRFIIFIIIIYYLIFFLIYWFLMHNGKHLIYCIKLPCIKSISCASKTWCKTCRTKFKDSLLEYLKTKGS